MKQFFKSSISISAALICSMFASTQVVAQQEIQIKTTKLSDSVYMLQGSGGHIGLSVGEDGVVMIDDQFAPLSDKIKAAVAEITDKPIKYVINTHWHGDHSGGNKNFADSGSVIVAHQNVRERMSKDQFMEMFQREVKASPKEALPVITFNDEINFHLNGDDIRVKHVSFAHTDGDAIIHFVNDNIIHTGDTVFSGSYPFIDTGSGGSIVGFLANLEGIIAMANADTQIIPGHGALTNKAKLTNYHAMLSDIYANYKTLKSQGKTIDEIVEIGISKKYDADFGQGFIKPDVLAKLIDSSVDRSMQGEMQKKSETMQPAKTSHRHGGDQSAHSH